MLTKSLYLDGLQCLKKLWFSAHDRSKFPEIDEFQNYIIRQGIEVGEFARTLFDGILVKDSSAETTKELVKKKKPLFEPVLGNHEVMSRVDILLPKNDVWDIIEVKSSTRVKDEHIADVSFQKYCAEISGLKIDKCYVMHINRDYVRAGEITEDIFMTEDITDRLVEIKIEEMQKTLSLKKYPQIKIGTYCFSPRQCPLKEFCWSFLPKGNVFNLYADNRTAFSLLDMGVTEMKDIDIRLKPAHRIQVEAFREDKIHINKVMIRKFLSSLKEPLHFLDFETIAPAIPLFDSTRPYQNIPFLYHLIVGEEHHSLIAVGDPRDKILSGLKNSIQPEGSIIAYSMRFEKQVLRDLAFWFPEEKEWIESVLTRFVDMMEIFRKFWYYNPEQGDSVSLKAVMPAVLGKGYEGLDIDNGGLAQVKYLEAIMNKEKSDDIFKNLETYCRRDTEGMKWILEKLRSFCSS